MRYLVLLVIASTLLYGHGLNILNDTNIILNYFEVKSVNHATVLGCFSKQEQIIISKMLMVQTKSVSVFNLNLDLNNKKLDEILKTNHYHVGVVLDGDCPQMNELLIMSEHSNFFDVKHHWLILASDKNVIRNIESLECNINADIHLAILNIESLNWTIFDVYNPASKHGGIMNFTEIGFYNNKLGYKINNHEGKYWARRNMTGVNFKSMVVLPVEYKGTLDRYLRSDEHRDINTFNRFHARLVTFCRDFYNFSVKTEKVRSWGYTNPDGTFDGMVGALERKIIDFGSSPLFLREDRARVIDYGRNTWILRAAFIFRNPKSRTSIEIFLHPLPTSVWIITGFLAIASIIILKSVTTFERKKYSRNVETSWSVSVLIAVGAFCQQGSPSTPRMTCGRITTISLFLLSVIIYQFYSASLVSHLLNKPELKIKNLKDLLDAPLKAGCEDILYDRDYFEHTTDEVARQLFNKKIQGRKNNSNFFSPEYGLKLVEKNGYAFHVETATAYPIIENTFSDKTICELREIQLFRTQPMHANYQKQSPFRDMFDTCFQRLAEHGLLYRERKHWHPRKPECIQSNKSTNFNVGLDDFYPALVILFLGILISLLILLIEKQYQIFHAKPTHPPIMFIRKPAIPYIN